MSTTGTDSQAAPRGGDEGSGYVPALGRRSLTALYDPAIRLTMRERRFRGALVDRVLRGPRPRDLLDLGCGTGTLAIQLARALPETNVAGVDPDEDVLARARQKADAAGVELQLVRGLGESLPFADRSFDRVVSSLVFHHLTPSGKRAALQEARRVLRRGGRLHIADWGRPRDPLMWIAFLGVRALDGPGNTREHAQGRLPTLVAEAGFGQVQITGRLRTTFGTLDFIDAAVVDGRR